MRLSRILANIFGVSGICAAALTVALTFQNIHAAPVLMGQPEAARGQVVTLMEAVSRSDYDAAAEVIWGKPDFGVDRAPENKVSAMIWKAFTKNYTYELVGELHATDSGLTQDIRVTTLDISSVTDGMKTRSEKLLEECVAIVEDPHSIYDENSEYRQDLIDRVLYEAARVALKKDREIKTVDVSVHMIFEEGSWWIVPDPALLHAISGGVLK